MLYLKALDVAPLSSNSPSYELSTLLILLNPLTSLSMTISFLTDSIKLEFTLVNS